MPVKGIIGRLVGKCVYKCIQSHSFYNNFVIMYLSIFTREVKQVDGGMNYAFV